MEKGRQYCPSSFNQTGQLSSFFQSTQMKCCSLWNCSCGSAPGKHATMDGWIDTKDRWEASGRVSLSGLAQRAESKWYRSTMADSMAPLITFSQSCIVGLSQHHSQTPPVSHLLSSIFPLHSPTLYTKHCTKHPSLSTTPCCCQTVCCSDRPTYHSTKFKMFGGAGAIMVERSPC